MISRSLRRFRRTPQPHVVFGLTNLSIGLTKHAVASFFAWGAFAWTVIRYKLNTGYILVFLLAFVIVASAWMGYFNLRRVRVSMRQPEDAFVGETVVHHIELLAPEKGPLRGNVDVFLGNDQTRLQLAPGQPTRASLRTVARQRGRARVPSVSIQSLFPMALWRMQGFWQPTQEHWVYPAPEKGATFNPPVDPSEGQQLKSVKGDEFVSGLRPYIPGDSPNRIAWRVLAKTEGQTLNTKNLESEQSRRIWIRDVDTGLNDPEAQLSRMAGWLLDAHHKGWTYGMQLGNLIVPPAHSMQHLKRCLQTLAAHPT